MPTHTRPTRAAIHVLLRLLPQDPWITPVNLAARLAVAGHTVREDPTHPGDHLIGPDRTRLSVMLKALNRDGHARQRAGDWVRTPSGTRHLADLDRAAS